MQENKLGSGQLNTDYKTLNNLMTIFTAFSTFRQLLRFVAQQYQNQSKKSE